MNTFKNSLSSSLSGRSRAALPSVKRVAYVISDLRAGGAERVVVHLSATLRNLHVATRIICLQDRGSLAAEAEANGVPVIALESTRGYDLRAILSLARELRTFQPSVINVHDRASLPYVWLANCLSRRRPIVFTAHGLLMRDARRRLCDRLAMHDVQAVTAVSRLAAKEYSKLLGWRKAIEIVANGVPPVLSDPRLGRAVRAELAVRADTFVYLAVGNVKPEKGFEDLIQAATELHRRVRSGMKFVVLVAGGISDEAYHGALLALLRRFGLQDVVRFLGFRGDTGALYSAADAFVLSSRKEGLPMVLLEAMTAGLPVIGTRVGAVPEVIEGEGGGLMVPPASPSQLAEAMWQVLNDQRLRKRLGSTARTRAQEHYSLERMANGYLDVYAHVGSASRRTSLLSRPRKIASSRSRILQLGPLPPLTGGMATAIANLCDSDLAKRFRLFTLNNGKTTRPGRTLLQGIIAQLRLLVRLSGLIRRERVALVHLHTCEFMGFWRDCVHMAVAQLMGCRGVWHVHGATFDEWAAKQGPTRKALLRLVFEGASAVIVLSPEWRRKLRRFAPNARWRVIQNGVPMPDEAHVPVDGTPSFLFLGDWSLRKGVSDLVAATCRAVAAHGFRGVVNLAGFEKEPGQRGRLDRLIAESGCRSQIKVLGLVAGETKKQALREALCLVLPSYGEGLPIAMLEAMGHGCAIIATKVGAIPELITHGLEGFLLEPGDVEALATFMGRLSAQPELARRMGHAARRRVEEDYALEVMARRTMEVYQEVLGSETHAGTVCESK